MEHSKECFIDIVIETTWTATHYAFQCPDYFGFYAGVPARINISYSRLPIIVDYHFFIITSCLFSLCCFKKVFSLLHSIFVFLSFRVFCDRRVPTGGQFNCLVTYWATGLCITRFGFAQPAIKQRVFQPSIYKILLIFLTFLFCHKYYLSTKWRNRLIKRFEKDYITKVILNPITRALCILYIALYIIYSSYLLTIDKTPHWHNSKQDNQSLPLL